MFHQENYLGASSEKKKLSFHFLLMISLSIFIWGNGISKKQLLNGEITQNEYDLWCARLKKSVEEDMQSDFHRKMIRQMEKDKKTE